MSERYGRTKVSKIRQAYNDLRSAIASGDMEKAQEAFDRYEQWSDYIYGEAKIDTSTEAVEALADRIEELEAKLAKAVEAAFQEGFLAGTEDGWVNNPRIKMEWKHSRARTTLAELKGEKDD